MKSATPYFTAGRFAKLASTTKRTVQWYKELGLLRPAKKNSKGYGFYTPEQVIDLQTIMLLRRLNFSLAEIKKLMKTNTSWQKLFSNKLMVFEDEVKHLQKSLADSKLFYQNIKTEGLLIKPEMKKHAAFDAFVLEKTGPYTKIYEYCLELKSQFAIIPQNATFFVLFPKPTYAPQKDTFIVGVVKTPEMKLKHPTQVKQTTIPGFTSLSYTHIGSPSLLSLLIMQLEQYRVRKKLKKDKTVGINQVEFYYKSGINNFHDEAFMISEINLPISSKND